MQENAQIICRREPFGEVCEWQGDERRGVARVGAPTIHRATGSKRIPAGLTFGLGGLKLRVVEFPVFADWGGAYDCAHVMLAHNPHGDLQVLYRSAVHVLLRFTLNCEARVHGFMLKPYEGKVMPFTDWLYKHLL